MKYIQIIMIATLGAAICSCNRDELFEREQYKNVFALLSEGSFNIFAEEHDLGNEETEGYVSAVCGGSLPTHTEINIAMVEDEDILLRYNRSNFDVDEDRYAQLLPRDRYDIEDLNITVPAGERKGLMKIRIHPDGLSPDSAYFIPLRADRFSAYELNPDKSYLLYRVLIKNFYAAQKTVTQYQLRGKRDGVSLMQTKDVYPVGGNKIRISAGDLTCDATKYEEINRTAIVVEVNEEDGHVTITPWKDIVVTQVHGDPDYPNIFKIENDGYKSYKTFLLCYDYEYEGITVSMQEELRLEYNEKKEQN
ncbi:MAG: DUF4361 domain-containing protein [Tannerella sp.]|jgi:hypothetical protein|nr:DUF4361 domain-containing protein [Tannerella sp.]